MALDRTSTALLPLDHDRCDAQPPTADPPHPPHPHQRSGAKPLKRRAACTCTSRRGVRVLPRRGAAFSGEYLGEGARRRQGHCRRRRRRARATAQEAAQEEP
eukprot:3275165-Prymnesium_polylepis.3